MTFSRDAFSLTTQKSLITDKIKQKERLRYRALKQNCIQIVQLNVVLSIGMSVHVLASSQNG